MNMNTIETTLRAVEPVAPAAVSIREEFTLSEVGALARFYRGKIDRSTIWGTRLDTTTNWAVVVTGVSFTVAFGSPSATALPLVLVGLLVAVFLLQDARRYRCFNVWRARARLMETDFYVPMLRGPGGRRDRCCHVNRRVGGQGRR